MTLDTQQTFHVADGKIVTKEFSVFVLLAFWFICGCLTVVTESRNLRLPLFKTLLIGSNLLVGFWGFGAALCA